MAAKWIQIVEKGNEDTIHPNKKLDILVVVEKNSTPLQINLAILKSLSGIGVFEGLEFHGNDLCMKVMMHPAAFKDLRTRVAKNEMKVMFWGLRHKMNKLIAFDYMNKWLGIFTRLYFGMFDEQDNAQYYWHKGQPAVVLPPTPYPTDYF